MTQPISSETVEYERYVDELRRSNAELLKAFRDYFNVPVLSKPGHEAEFFRAARNAHEILSRANGIVSPPVPVKIITVRVEGGMVADVDGVPAGYELRVEDYDHADDSHPAWNAEKECFVTVYDGGANS